MLKKLIEMGANRWTRGQSDRLYLNSSAEKIIGLEVESYKDGDISSATLKGEKIGNGYAKRIRDSVSSIYIDLKTGEEKWSGKEGGYVKEVLKRIRK